MNLTKAVLSFASLSTICFNTYAYDLTDAFQQALKHDIQYQTEFSNLRAAEATLPQADSAFAPQLSAQGKGNLINNNNSSNPSSSTTSAAGSLVYSQLLYSEQNEAVTAVASASIELAKLNIKVAKNDLLIRTAEAYFTILRAKNSLEFARTEQKAIARQLEQAKKRFEVGLTAITDVKEVQALFDKSVAAELSAENQLDISLQSLELITGKIGLNLNTIDSDVSFDYPTPNDSEHWAQLAIQNNLNVLKAQANLAIAAANRKKSQSVEGMTVNASGSYGITISDNSASGSNTARDASIGILLNLPLFTGGSATAQIAEQEAKYQSAKDGVILQKRIAAQQARTFYLSIVSGIGQINALHQASISSQTALDATNAGFEVGTRTSVDVLSSIKETYRSQRDESSSRYDYLINLLKLKQATGTLNDQDIAQINRFLSNKSN